LKYNNKQTIIDKVKDSSDS